jgi:hypothetical protein
MTPVVNSGADLMPFGVPEAAIHQDRLSAFPCYAPTALATFRRKIGWRWLLDRIDWFAENCKIGRIWVDVGCDH